MTSPSTGNGTVEPTIVGAAVAPGHDGLAEVLIDVRYPNGAVRSLSLPIDAIEGGLDAARVTSLDQLVGQPWTTLAVRPLAPGSTSNPTPTCAPTPAPTLEGAP